MSINQTKNNIKTIALVLASLFFGEGIFGLGVYWPLFLLLSDWVGIYWFGLGMGVLISIVSEIRVGLPSFFVVVLVSLVSMFVGVKKSSRGLLVALGVIANLLFDKLFGLHWSFGEMLIVLGVGLVVMRGLDKQEIIRLNY